MLVHILIGAVAVYGFMLLQNYVQKAGLVVKGWQWLLTVLGFAYGIMVLEIIYAFALEGRGEASLVMGLVTGVFAVIWAVLLGRFVFAKKA